MRESVCETTYVSNVKRGTYIQPQGVLFQQMCSREGGVTPRAFILNLYKNST